MSTEQMRIEIAKVYKGDKWRTIVANMPDKQVYAVYMSFVQRKLVK